LLGFTDNFKKEDEHGIVRIKLRISLWNNLIFSNHEKVNQMAPSENKKIVSAPPHYLIEA